MEFAAVAKKRKGGPGRKPTPRGPRTSLVAFKCHDEYKAWLEEFARSERTTPSQLLDLGLVMLAKSKGFDSPPER